MGAGGNWLLVVLTMLAVNCQLEREAQKCSFRPIKGVRFLHEKVGHWARSS